MLIRFMPLILVVALIVTMSAAIGAKGFFLFTWGEEIYETGPLPEQLSSQYPGWTAGYKCSVFGVFWANIHVWGCEPVVSDGESYYDQITITKPVAELYSMSDAQRGFWDKHGRWVFLSIIVLCLLSQFASKSEDP